MRILTPLCLLILFASGNAALAGSPVAVKDFPGATVGEKIAAAEAACGTDAASACLLVLDPSLASLPAGSIPPLCPQCSIQDSRGGGQPFQGQPSGNFQTLASLPATGSADAMTNRLRNFIQSTANEPGRHRGVLWIGPQEPADALDKVGHPLPPAEELDSSQRIIDLRGTNCMDFEGLFTGNDNAICIEGAETDQDATGREANPTLTMNRGLAHFSYNSLRGGTYNYTSPGHGTKSNRTALTVNGEYHTVAQNSLIVGAMNCLTGGECLALNVLQVYPGGYVGPGEEPMEGIRLQQQQTYSSSDGAGGQWLATGVQVNPASGVVSFTPGANPHLLAEARPIRDLDSLYSTGSYSAVSCAGANPSTCTVTGADTNWTSIRGFVGTHTTFMGLGGPIQSTNLVFCPGPGAEGGYDACVPVTEGVDATHLTLNVLGTGSQQNTAWPWAHSGKYAIYSVAWPTQVDIVAHTFTTPDASRIGNGHRVDQVLAYNGDLWGMLVYQSRHVGRPYGGGINIIDGGSAQSPGFGCGICVSGNYATAYAVGSSGTVSGNPAVALGINKPATVGVVVDNVGGSDYGNGWRYMDSNRTLQTAFGYTRNAASPVAGLSFFANKAYITTSGNAEFTHLGNANNSSDLSGAIAIHGAASGSFNFAEAYATAPRCVASPTSNPGSVTWWVTSTAKDVTVHLSAAATIEFNYICAGT
jgi:hypothetical protein